MAALAQRHLVVDDVLEFLRGVEPALDGDVFERFVEHDVMLEDLRDPGFDGEVLQRMGIVKVGVQLRILRAINAAFPSRRRGGGEGAAPLPIREQPRRQRFPTKSSHRRPAAYSDTELAGDARNQQTSSPSLHDVVDVDDVRVPACRIGLAEDSHLSCQTRHRLERHELETDRGVR